MISRPQRYPTNDAGTVLSAVEHLDGLYVERANGGSSLWKATFDYPKSLMQYKGSSEKSMTWKGAFAIDAEHEWKELFLRRNEIQYVELVIGTTCFTTYTDYWVTKGWDDVTPNGPRRLLAKKWWTRIDYA